MKKAKKIIGSCLVLSMLLATSALAVDANTPVIIVEDDMVSQARYQNGQEMVTVSEIDQLCDERLEAVVTHDMEKYNEVTETLRGYGVEEISYDEAVDMVGVEATFENSNGVPLAEEIRGGIIYETYDSIYTLDGKKYDIRRILASPDPDYPRDSLLYTTGDTDEFKNDYSAKANAMKLAGIGVETIAGLASNTIGAVQTVYGVLTDVHDALSPTDTVTNIRASYTWNIAEACSFVLVRNSGTLESYLIRGVYHKAAAALGVNVPTLAVDGHDIVADISQGKVRGTATPVNYNSTLKAVQGFVNGRRYQSSVTDIIFRGVENQIVEERNLRNPMTPNEAGY